MFKVTINNIQNINYAEMIFDENQPGLTCIVGKNASGKTTLIRSIANIAISDVFLKQCNRHIFQDDSKIEYEFEEKKYSYIYVKSLKGLNCKGNVPSQDTVKKFSIESTYPYGGRFNFINRIAPSEDTELRIAIGKKQYSEPTDLISFMNNVYNTEKFSTLKEVTVDDKQIFFFMIKEKYVREDYFSTGEFFLINLYRTFMQIDKKIIVIDEIDTSLDAEAQSNLIKYLREFSENFNKKIIFTSHSLALIKTLKDDELFYLNNDGGKATIDQRSYYYIKSSLFGFGGFDKYILVEDVRTRNFITYLINTIGNNVFFKYKIIPVGTAGCTFELYTRNIEEMFLSEKNNVLLVLDGDQSLIKGKKDENHYYLPVADIEKYFLNLYTNNIFILKEFCPDIDEFIMPEKKQSKKLFAFIEKKRHENEMYEFIIKNVCLSEFINKLTVFLKISS